MDSGDPTALVDGVLWVHLYGEAGNDVLWGDAGPDRLVGGYGDDDLHGGSGMDGLFAHQGTDTYDGGPASDRIYVGFTPLFFTVPSEDAGFHIVNGTGGEQKYGETWLYNPAVTFYRGYGHSHPKEDWSTCWEAYFFGATPVDDAGILDVDSAWMQTHMPGKSALLHLFLA